MPLDKFTVAESAFDKRLAVVKVSVNGEVDDIGGARGGHLFALDVRDASFGMQDDDPRRRPAGEGGDRRGAGVARSRRENRDSLAAMFQKRGDQLSEILHCEIFEGETRPVKKFKEPSVAAEADERRRLGTRKVRVGALGERQEAVGENRAGREEPHDLGDSLGERKRGGAGERGGGKTRPLGRHIESAVRGESREEQVVKGARGGLSAR